MKFPIIVDRAGFHKTISMDAWLILCRGTSMNDRFAVDHLDVERLLADWRWLCPQKVALVARNAFGDLFLRDEAGEIFWLDVSAGKLTRISITEAGFRELAETADKRAEWFAELQEQTAVNRGLRPGPSRCIAFPTPLAFAESGANNAPYLADLYEHVSFLGDLHRQISGLPEGAKVRLRIDKPPST